MYPYKVLVNDAMHTIHTKDDDSIVLPHGVTFADGFYQILDEQYRRVGEFRVKDGQPGRAMPVPDIILGTINDIDDIASLFMEALAAAQRIETEAQKYERHLVNLEDAVHAVDGTTCPRCNNTHAIPEGAPRDEFRLAAMTHIRADRENRQEEMLKFMTRSGEDNNLARELHGYPDINAVHGHLVRLRALFAWLDQQEVV